MKKIALLFAIVLAFGLSAFTAEQASAQTGYFLSSPGHANIDTVDNTESIAQTKQITGTQACLSIQTTVTKISGTVGGTLTLSGSLDGVTYDVIGSDVFTATNVASQCNIWALGQSNYVYYRVTYAGTGTMSAKMQTYYILRN